MKQPFLDTSILISGHIDFGESSQDSMRILDLIADGTIKRAASAWHCCLEFFSVTTRLPEEYRLSPETAAEFVHEEIMGCLGIDVLEAQGKDSFFLEAMQHKITGGRIYDYHIGMIALTSGASVIVTNNKKHFLHFETLGLPVRSDTEYLDMLSV